MGIQSVGETVRGCGVQATGWLLRGSMEEKQAASGGLCSRVDTEQGIILSSVRHYSHAGKGSTFCQMLWPLPLQRPQPISALQLAGPEAAGLQALVGLGSF